MAKYTVELRKLVENGFDLQLNEYPIFDENYRETLNKKIIDHYYFYEIGQETAGQFRHYLKSRMNEIMPYYNQLYRSELLELDPLTTFKETHVENIDRNGTDTTHNSAASTSDSNGNGSTTNTTTNSGGTEVLNVHSDTPQGQITESEIKQNKWASSTDYTKTNVNNDTTQANGGNSYVDNNISYSTADGQRNYSDIENKLKTKYGYNKSPAELLDLYRKTFLNIDMMIIDELADLFMLIW